MRFVVEARRWRTDCPRMIADAETLVKNGAFTTIKVENCEILSCLRIIDATVVFGAVCWISEKSLLGTGDFLGDRSSAILPFNPGRDAGDRTSLERANYNSTLT